jgi:hypothetical protein
MPSDGHHIGLNLFRVNPDRHDCFAQWTSVSSTPMLLEPELKIP